MNKTVYQLDAAGYFVGDVSADKDPLGGGWLIPALCVEVAPPEVPEGMRARFADGWTLEALPAPEPEPAPPSPAEIRRAEILARLSAIDAESISPLRAVAAGTATIFDTAKLTALDTEAAQLRAELAGLV